jgi:hypothetical protein
MQSHYFSILGVSPSDHPGERTLHQLTTKGSKVHQDEHGLTNDSSLWIKSLILVLG